MIISRGTGKNKQFYDLQYSIFANLLDLESCPKGIHVDMGCGYGHFLSYLADNFNNVELIGCEVFGESAQYVKKSKIQRFEKWI